MNNSTRTIFWLGVALLFVPFLGVPSNAKAGITIAIAIALIVTARKVHYSASRAVTQRETEAVTLPDLPKKPDMISEITHVPKRAAKQEAAHDNEPVFHI